MKKDFLCVDFYWRHARRSFLPRGPCLGDITTVCIISLDHLILVLARYAGSIGFSPIIGFCFLCPLGVWKVSHLGATCSSANMTLSTFMYKMNYLGISENFMKFLEEIIPKFA